MWIKLLTNFIYYVMLIIIMEINNQFHNSKRLNKNTIFAVPYTRGAFSFFII
ncbi:MAG: hypothetical protein KatS3mg097_388 [Candidatus Parcubacteria bacterium]|nr:MAG: hypothetical protein KatS3mg097_388 [Candidatus Parcubacteria bacterium]